MDFRTLTRRELQALCKKNKIPANTTNVAMADALQSLDLVEGIEDFLKPSESESASSSAELPQNSDLTSQSVPSTGRRTAQRKTVKKNETETSQSSTRTRNVDDDVVETPVVPTVGRRAATKEKQDIPKTPGAMLTSQKREAKDKSSVGQVYSIRRSARLAAKRLKESSKQDNKRPETITFDNFSEAATEGLEMNPGQCSLHFEDEVEKAGIDVKTASDEGLDKKKAKEGATDLSASSFETENLNLLNKELKVDMPKSSEELATGDKTNEIIENNVDMLLSEKLGEGEESNDDKAIKLDSSLDIGPANIGLAENSANNALSDGKESHYDECLNMPDSLQDPHVLPVAPKSCLQLDHEDVNSDMVPKQMDESNEPNANKISTIEAGDGDFTLDGDSKSIGLSSGKESNCDDCVNLPDLDDGDVGPDSLSQLGQVTVSDGMILPKELKDPSTKQISVGEVEDAEDDMGLSKQLLALNINCCEVKDVDPQCKVQEVVGKDDDIKHISDCEVQGADLQYKGQPLDNEDEPSTEEVSDLKDENADHQCSGQDVVDDNLVLSKQLDDEDETNTKEISYAEGENAAEANSESEGEGQLDKFTSGKDEVAEGISSSEDEDTSQTRTEDSEGESSLDELGGDENGPNAKEISLYGDSKEGSSQTGSEDSEGELSVDELGGDENGLKAKGISPYEDSTEGSSESLDGELSSEEYCVDDDATESIPENSDAEFATEAGSESLGSELSEDEEFVTQTSSEDLDGEESLEKFTGDEKEPNNEGLSFSEDEDATEAGSEDLDGEESLEKFTGDDEKEPNNEGLSFSEDEDDSQTSSEDLDGEQSSEKFTGDDEKEPNNEGLSDSDDEDATEAGSESSGIKESHGEFAGDTAETNVDTIGDQQPVQEEYMQNSARKGPSGLQNVVEAPFVSQVDHTGGSPLSALALDHKQIPSSKTPITRMSAPLKCVSDDKENVDNSGRKLVRLNNKLKLEIGSIKENKKKHHEDCSPGEITKSNANAKEITRPALQQLQENCLVEDSGSTIEG